MDSDIEIEFDGTDGTACERFVLAMQRHGRREGKTMDDEWMAELASTCLAGSALRWWCTLGDDVQRSWRLLRAALLQQYPQTSHLAPIPTPAAAVMRPHPTRTGCIKVICSDAYYGGYLGTGCQVVRTLEEALRIQVSHTGPGLITLLNPARLDLPLLAATFNSDGLSARVCLGSGTDIGGTVASSDLTGLSRTTIWTVTAQNSITATWTRPGGDIVLDVGVNNSVYLFPNFAIDARKSGCMKARLVFEET